MSDCNSRTTTGHSFAIRSIRWVGEEQIVLTGCADCIEMYWVRLGNAQVSMGNGARILRPGDLVTLNTSAMLVQAGRNAEGYRIQVGHTLLAQFRSDVWFEALVPFLAVLESRSLHIRFAAEDRAEVDWLLSRMLRVHQWGAAELSNTSLRLLFGQFLLLCHQRRETGEQDSKAVSSSGEDVIRGLQAYIDDHLSHSFGLAQLAQKAGYAPSYLSSLFTKTTGQRLNEYICRNRIARAQDLLRSTHLKVMQVCYDVGFRDLAHFNRTFKKMVGVTPTAYRYLHSQGKRDQASI